MTKFPLLLSPLLAAALAMTGCSKKTAKQGAGSDAPVPVLAEAVRQQDSPVEIEAIGQVQPFATVSIKPQVTGQISEVHFTEGQDVKPGDLLYTIDKRPFEVALNQAQAALDQAAASSRNAERQAARYTELSKRGAVAKEQFDQIQLTRETTAAAVKSAEAAVRNAELQLEYCDIRSPISGRTGNRLADRGNVVTANATDLVVINQLQPIFVSCTVAERYLGELARYLATPQGVTARAIAEGALAKSAEGPVTFLDNTVKPGSGTVQLKATFQNEDHLLWPGQFVAVQLTLTTQKGATVIPGNAVLTGQDGQYVFVIKADGTVDARTVKINRRNGDLAVIDDGLKAGEMVVIDGQSQLTPGARVEIKAGLAADAPVKLSQSGSPEKGTARP